MTRMIKKGLNTDAFSSCITSGEVAWNLLREKGGSAFGAGGNKCIAFTLGDNYTRTFLQGLKLNM